MLQKIIGWLVSDTTAALREFIGEIAINFLSACTLFLSIKGLEVLTELLWPGGKVFWVVDMHRMLDVGHFITLAAFIVFSVVQFITLLVGQVNKVWRRKGEDGGSSAAV